MITVFTPTYNRGYILEKLYDSLKRQSCKDFEWIVVDDGSTDNTPFLFEQWKSEDSGFPIIYIKEKNGGKHRAINKGVQIAVGEAFFIVDSDDYLSDDAIAFVKYGFDQIANDEEFAGISGLRYSYRDNSTMGGNPNFREYVDATNLEREKYHLLGDKAEVYKTDLLRRYPFPEYEGENFITEGVIWNSIALDGYKIRWFNKKIYYCDYLQDGLTKNLFEVYRKNPLGWADYIKREKKYECSKNIFKHMYQFFECMHFTYSEDELMRILEIDKSECDILRNTWEYMLKQFKEKLQKDSTHTLALYGIGSNSKRLMLYAREIELRIYYYIDKNCKQKNESTAIYTVEEELPYVDSICITSKKISEEWEVLLKNKMPDTTVWRIEELGDWVWG